MKILAIDYGDARTGIAVSDSLGMLVGTTDVIHAYRPEVVAAEIQKRAIACGAERLVLGLPKNMDGTEGPRAQLCRDFAAQLEQLTGLPVILWD